MKSSRRCAVLALALGVGWASGCGSSADMPSLGASGGSPQAGTGGTTGKPGIVTTGGDDNTGGPEDGFNPLCGKKGTGACVPDDASACRSYVPPAQPGAGGASPQGVGGGGGAAEGGDAAGGAESNLAGQAGAGEGGAISAAGQNAGGQGGEASPPVELASYSCQITRENNQPLAACVPAGRGTANAPCFGAADCAPSFACVTEGDAGRCLPYCCEQDSTCERGTYCAERPLRQTSTGDAPHVPVCVPADGCSLEDPYPCPAGMDCRCKGDTACMVVRDAGTTTCITPGAGEQGDACPCAWNHVCSKTTNQCFKICRTDPTKNDCGEQKCQASSELPMNFGVCVGPLK